MNITQVSNDYAVSPQLTSADIDTLKDMGFTTVICNRPDNEEAGQPTAAEIAAIPIEFKLVDTIALEVPKLDEQRHL